MDRVRKRNLPRGERHCVLPSGARDRPREPGIAYERKFDRCLPSLIAFKREAEARAYKRRYGGRILSYQEAIESVRHR